MAHERITRRGFCICMFASGALFSSSGSISAAKEGDFVCATTIPDIHDDINLQSTKDESDFQPTRDEGGSDLTLQGAARAKLRWRATDGLPGKSGAIRLGVGFVEDYPESWKEEVIVRARRWLPEGSDISRRIEFDFNVPLSESQIRIRQTGINDLPAENKSFIGREALSNSIDNIGSTMYIYNLTSVEHEFGHALCLTHEHQHEAMPVTINREKAIRYFAKPPNNWSAKTTLKNLFGPSERCIGDKGWNANSIMGYNIPAEITNEGVGLYTAREINARDRRCLDAIYLQS